MSANESGYHPNLGESLHAPKRARLEYGAVPLRPLQAMYPDASVRDGYLSASLHHIQEKLHRNFAFVKDRLDIHDFQARALEEFVEMSLVEAQMTRADYNDHRSLPANFGDNGEIEAAALAGTATPDELLHLLESYPELESIELAKLSHPFDFAETGDMESAVRIAIGQAGGEIVGGQRARYKLKRTDGALMAMIFVRKQIVGHVPTEQGNLEIVERRSLLTLDTSENGRVMKHYIENDESPEALHAITVAIERRLSRGELEDTGWLFPTTTSYYARRAK